MHTAVRQNLWVHACVCINNGKTKVWNAAGRKPAVCEVLDRVAQAEDPHANVWRGSEVATERQGLLLLGAPLGHPDFVAAQLRKTSEEHEQFLARIRSLPDLQAAWLLLVHCANARANYLLRVVPPDLVAGFAQAHDAPCGHVCSRSWGSQRTGAMMSPGTQLPSLWQWAGLVCGALCGPAHRLFLGQLGGLSSNGAETAPRSRSVHCGKVEQPAQDAIAAAAAEQLNELPGFTPRSWHALAMGARPPPREPEEKARNFLHWLAARGFLKNRASSPRPVVLDHDGV